MPFEATAVPGDVPRNSDRPPTGLGNPAPPPGAAVPPPGFVRPAAGRRRLVSPLLWEHTNGGFPAQHPYVRRFWTAAIGSGAVADLMRLAVAAQRGRSLPLPPTLPLLTREGLICWSRGRLFAGTAVPPLPDRHVRRMAPSLQREHQFVLSDLHSEA
ncbi:MAG: hypothetical protein ABFR89_09585 [Actinomycetota bacterium]